jgi:hypothetical protein
MDIWEDIKLPPNIAEDEIDGFKKKEFLYKFAVDTWLDKLRQHTFETQILPLSPKSLF